MVTFYNVKKREKVEIDEKECTRVVYTRQTAKGEQKRYALKAQDEGTNLTKFINKETFDKMSDLPVEEKK
jgi:hypothetical protein